jgi:hypothetical protein
VLSSGPDPPPAHRAGRHQGGRQQGQPHLDKVETEVAEILREAAEADQREDRQHGQARGDELPTALANPTGRLARLRQAKVRLEADAAERQHRYQQ